MKNETKLILNRGDELDLVVDKVLRAPTFAVTLVIPRDATLGHSLSNFNALKRESDTAGKALSIESNDEHILELALRAKIMAKSGTKEKERPVTDIVRRVPKSSPKEVVLKKEKERASRKEKDEEEHVPMHVEEESSLEKRAPTFFKKIEPSELFNAPPVEVNEVPIVATPKKKRTKRIVFALGILVAVGLVVAFLVLPKATITLFLKRVSVTSEDTIQVGKDVKEVSLGANLVSIPGELFVEHGNTTMSFPASGKETVTLSAKGTIVVTNAYSVSPQPLLKSTRFESTDGKIFRLDKAVTIPGAKRSGGTLIPSKIEVTVTAAAAGDASNILTATHWTIPGFKGTPRYKGFYGDSSNPMTGGMTGERPVLSDADRAAAENAVSDALKASLGMRIQAMADKFKTFSSSTSFVVARKEERMDAGDSTKFNLFMEGEMRQIVFDENVLRDALVKEMRTKETDTDAIDAFSVEYGTPRYDFDKGTITFAAKSTVAFVPVVDTDKMKQTVAGTKKTEAEAAILSIPRLESATIAFWPFWVSSVPKSLSRIEVIIK